MHEPQTPITTLNKLLVLVDRSHGARALGYDFLYTLKKALSLYSGASDYKKVKQVLVELTLAIDNSRPRIALLLRYARLISGFANAHKNVTVEEINAYIDTLIRDTQKKSEELISHAYSLMKTAKTILLHTHSNTVLGILKYTIGQGKKPNIIIAAQEEQKTHALIKEIHDFGLSFTVVPEYVVAHITEEIDFALFGALTYNSHDECVMSPGSGGIIAELHNLKIPCYVAMETDKFSLWKDEKKYHTLKIVNMRMTEEEHIQYEKLTFSHDRVPLGWLTGMITEFGLCSPQKVRKIFDCALEGGGECKDV